jgi:prepilin-type N-terminal cleavage/methylation domain-containing protein
MDTGLQTRYLEKGRLARGFTLMELLVAVLVGLLVLAGLHRIFVAGLKTQNTTSLQSEANRKAQVAIDEMVSKLRGASEVKDASGSQIWFLDQEDNNCRYWLDNGTLYAYCGAAAGNYSGGTPLAHDVSQLGFEYSDSSGQPAAGADAVYSVSIVLEVERARHVSRLHSGVRLRNK